MPPVNGRPLRGKTTDFEGRKGFAYACGKTLCDTNANKEQMWIDPYPDPFPIVPTIFQGRFVGHRNGKKRFAIASECHPQPIEAGAVNFVCKDVWCVPFGVTDVIRFKWYVADFPITAQCFADPDPCPEVLLEWNGARKWTGSFDMAGGGSLVVELELTDTQDPNRPLAGGWPVVRKWEVTFSGCVDPPVTRQANISCYYPLKGGGQYGNPLDVDCCDPHDAPDVAFSVEGFTNRFMPARLVDFPGHKKFFSSRCCDPDPDCQITECCGCDVSPYEWSLTVAGVVNATGTRCDCHNGTWILGMTSRNAVTGVCQWASPPGPCAPNAPAAGMWQLSCDPGANTVTLSTQNTPNGGGAATYTRSLTGWDCVGPNTLALSFSSPQCSGWPATVTLVPV